MFYSQVRSKIQSGDVLAWTHKSWKTWYDIKIQLVRFFTQSEYCHVGIAWVVGGRVFVLEAVMPKLRIYPLSKEVPFYWLPQDEDLTYWTNEVEEFALSCVGEDYSQFQAVMAQLDKVERKAGYARECAEFVQSVLQKGGKILDVKPTPTEVVHAVQTFGGPTFLVQLDKK